MFEVFAVEGEGFALRHTLKEGDTLETPLLPGLSIPVHEVSGTGSFIDEQVKHLSSQALFSSRSRTSL